jgi:hypothetical protein
MGCILHRQLSFTRLRRLSVIGMGRTKITHSRIGIRSLHTDTAV